MSKDEHSKPTLRPSTLGGAIATSYSLGFEALDAPGRRGVRIFAMSRQHMIMSAVGGAIVGIPLAFFVALLPIWDYVGEFVLIKKLNALVAPGIEGIPYKELPDFPLKRVLVAMTSMVELLFLGNVFALFARKIRRHALLVWICYDRKKLLQYFSISGLIFGAAWYILFINWNVLAFMMSLRRGGGVPYLAVLLPLMAFIFGHLATIVGLGLYRDASRKLRR
jgi:hypothetical protein